MDEVIVQRTWRATILWELIPRAIYFPHFIPHLKYLHVQHPENIACTVQVLQVKGYW